MEIGGTTILGNTHTYIHIYIYICMYICHLQVGIQAMYPTVTIYSTAFHPPDFVSISSCPVDTGPLHLEKKRSGLWSVEGVGLVGVELKTHVCRYLSKKKWKQIAGYWLVVEPTHLEKYGTVKNGFIFPKFRGENSKKCGRKPPARKIAHVMGFQTSPNFMGCQ